MKVLIATTLTQGDHPDDYTWALDGELVYLPEADCSDRACGCDRGFAGMASARATSTAMVVERSDLSLDDLSLALIDSLSRQGWISDGWSSANDEVVDVLWSRLVQTLEHFPAGSIVEREGDMVRARAVVADENVARPR